MARLAYNNTGGTLGAPMLSTDTTISFQTAPPFATISQPGDYIPIILEPATGTTPSTNFEVVYLTAYTAGQTSGTILRGQEDTNAVGHNGTATWTVGPLAVDGPNPRVYFEDLCSSSVMPYGTSFSYTGGSVTYDSTNQRRHITGSATYFAPAFNLNGIWIIESWYELLTASSTGGVTMTMSTTAGAATPYAIQWALQGDGNLVLYVNAGTVAFAAGTSGKVWPQGCLYHMMLVIDPTGFTEASISTQVSPYGNQVENNANENFYTYGYQNNSITSGETLQPLLIAQSTQQIGLYGYRISRGRRIGG